MILFLVSVGSFLCCARTTAAAAAAEAKDEEFVCNVYVAPSTIPGTGLGMYAGAKGYQKGETITKSLGDHIINIVDLKEAHADTGLYDRSSEDMTKYFLWDQYTWTNTAFGIHFTEFAKHQVDIASPGFGAAANSFMDFVNVEEGGAQHGLLDDPSSPQQQPNYHVHRSKDPGAGAFTTSHSRKAWASQDIAPNAEFFVSYGNEWFTDRQWRLGTIPVEGDHDDAEWLWKIFNKEFLGRNVSFGELDEGWKAAVRQGRRNYNDENEEFKMEVRKLIRETNPPLSVNDNLKSVHRAFWDEVVATTVKSVWDESRIMAAMPWNAESDEYESMLTNEGGYIEAKRQKMVRSPEWLENHGTCADSVRIGRSSLPNNQAGHGAFTKTSFEEGQVIMAAPLIHIPDKALLDTFYFTDQDEEETAELKETAMDYKTFDKKYMQHFAPGIDYFKTGEQLLLNYVFGHRNSTMVLSPYGPGVQLINHNQTLANVRLQWAEPHRSNHHPELLEKSVTFINDEYPLGSVLGMEIVATKAIGKNEELFLDYGDEWEEAWQKHVKEWKPKSESHDYVSATDLNTLPQYLNKPLSDWLEKDKYPFPKTVRLLVSIAWTESKMREVEGDDFITEEVMYNDFEYNPVEAVFKTGTLTNRYKYLVEDQKLFDKLLPKQQEHVLKKYEQAKADATLVDTTEDPSVPDSTLYTVVTLVKNEDSGQMEQVSLRDIPRRGLKFEDRGYTQDQFLDNAFREYIRIPDDIFPEAWKNLPTDRDKHEHYWKYRINPDDPDRTPWYELMDEYGSSIAEDDHDEDGDDDVYDDEDEGDDDEEEEIAVEEKDGPMSMHELLEQEEGFVSENDDSYQEHDEF